MNLKQNLIIIGAIIFIGLVFIFYNKFTNDATPAKVSKTIPEEISKYLTNKYNEEFSKPKFVKKSNITEKNGYQTTEVVMNYYIATSKDNIDVTIYFKEDTTDFADTYKIEEEELNKNINLFDLINSKFSNVVDYYTIKEDYHQLNLAQTKSRDELIKGLKTTYDCPVNYLTKRTTQISLKIKQNAYLFSKANYANLLAVLQYLNQNQTEKITFEFKILTLDNVEIKYDSSTKNIIVNDLNAYISDMARNEELAKFVQRNGYTIKEKKY